MYLRALLARGRLPVLLLVGLGCGKLKEISQCVGVSCAVGETCSPLSGECVPTTPDAGALQGCAVPADCRGAQPHCEVATRRCVGCLEDAHCPYGACDLSTKSCAPAPDSCVLAQALDLSSGAAQVTGDTRGAADDMKAACAVGQSAPDLVYAFTLTATRRVSAKVQPASGSSLLPVLALRKACGGLQPADQLGCGFSDPLSGGARLVVDALPPGTYFLWLDGDSGSAGAFSLSVSAEVPPAGDSCSTAEPLALVNGVAEVVSSTAHVSDDAVGTCGGAGPDRIYRLSLSAPQRLQLELTSQEASYAPVLYVRRSACESGAGSAQVACQSSGAQGSATLDLPNLPAGTYFIFVDGTFSGGVDPPTSGGFRLKLTALPPLPPPGNDACGAAAALPLPLNALGSTVVSGDTSAALSDATSGVCGGAAPDLVYALDLPAARRVTARVTPQVYGSGLWPVVYLRRPGKCDSELPQDLIACNGAVSQGGSAVLDVGNLPAGSYSLWVDGASTTRGPFTLTVELAAPAAPPLNDVCSAPGPLPLELGPVTVQGTTAAANDDASTCQVPQGAPSPDVVYQLDLTAEHSLAIDVKAAPGSSLKPVLALRNNQCASSATNDQVFCVWADALFPDRIAFATGRLVPGRYHLWVDGDYTSVGDFQLTARLGAPVATPTNDDCTNPLPLKPLVAGVTGDTRSASNSTRGVCQPLDGQSGEYAGDVAYSFSIATPRQVTVTVVPDAVEGAQFRPVVYVRGPTAATCASLQPQDQVKCGAASTYGGTVVLALGTLPTGDYTVWVDGAGPSRGKFTIAIQ